MATSGRPRLFSRLALSPSRAVLVVGLFGVLLAVAMSLPRGGFPAPLIHDEFSYLLTADTFAHGRLANPPHPLGVFFESFQILQQPVYVSKYPPGQGALLALGQVLTGQPIVGVWLSYGFMCAALTWMLFAWVRPRWALGGGLFAALFLVGYQADLANWAATYWGGAVAATGGALLFGGLKRTIDRPAALPAGLMALGVAILANSRPYEGLLASVPPGLLFLSWLWRGRARTDSGRRLRALGAVVLVLASFGMFMGTYNARITGSPWKLPYALYEETYGPRSAFLWGTFTPVAYRHEMFKRFHDQYLPPPQTPRDFAAIVRDSFLLYQQFFVPIFMIPLILLMPWVLRDRKLLVPAASVGLVGLGVLGESFTFGHYAAPLVAPLLLLYTVAARRLALLRTSRAPIGKHLLRFVLACIILSAFHPVLRLVRKEGVRWNKERVRIEQRLAADGARHLVIVDYGPRHDPNYEWVYNRSQIDASPVIWARSMGREENQKLLRYYADRITWSLHVPHESGPFELQPIAKPGGPAP